MNKNDLYGTIKYDFTVNAFFAQKLEISKVAYYKRITKSGMVWDGFCLKVDYTGS